VITQNIDRLHDKAGSRPAAAEDPGRRRAAGDHHPGCDALGRPRGGALSRRRREEMTAIAEALHVGE
jgi:hypothetical protein